MFRTLRIVVLLFILATVAQGAWLARVRTVEWRETVRVVIYPINGDGSGVSEAYIRGLAQETFRPVEEFMNQEARRYGLGLAQPVEVRVAPRVEAIPPAPPRDAGIPGAVVWSLRMRYFAWANDTYRGPRPQVRMFVLYFDPARHPRLAHSAGLQKGLIGRVNAFGDAAQEGSNNVVIAHELLHTFGATDKYDFANNRPVHPYGYAEPARTPLYPQRFAEIMAGRIPLSETRSEIPRSLEETLIGALTALEINWAK
ncbi:MAG: hypothetical protein HY323_11970 [Betaproteobacteria bacterium]|nr:hypothetical protein [Betaproteobacteria bacterium]MBI3937684.1 hypothetical protein [Betaproteobacteria bacterium]